MIPRYLYPIEDELPIPHYLTKLELGIEEKVEKPKRNKKTKKKKLRRKIKTHRKSIR